MPIDPSIALQSRVPEPGVAYDPVGQMARQLQIQRAIQGNQTGQLAYQHALRQQEEEQAMRDVLARHGSTIGSREGDQAYLRDLAGVSPGAYLTTRGTFTKEDTGRATAAAALLRGKAATEKNSLERIKDAQARLAGIWAQVKDQASHDRALAMSLPIYEAASMGANGENHARDLPLEGTVGTTYDPQRVAQFTAAMRSGPERISALVDARERESMGQQATRHAQDVEMRGKELGQRRAEMGQRGAQFETTQVYNEKKLAQDNTQFQQEQALQKEKLAQAAEQNAAGQAVDWAKITEERNKDRRGLEKQRAEITIEADKKQWMAISEKAARARALMGQLTRIQELREKPHYEASVLSPVALATYRQTGIASGYDAQIMANTEAIASAGAAMIPEAEKLATQGFTDADARLMAKGLGDLAALRPKAIVDTNINALIRRFTQTMKYADIVRSHLDSTARMPDFTPAKIIDQIMREAKKAGVTGMTPAKAAELARDQGLIE